MAETSASGAMRTVIDDPVVRVALRELDRKLRERFGREYLRLILFGSRARGDSKPDSDADVAVVLRGHIDNRWSLRRLIIRDTYRSSWKLGFISRLGRWRSANSTTRTHRLTQLCSAMCCERALRGERNGVSAKGGLCARGGQTRSGCR